MLVQAKESRDKHQTDGSLGLTVDLTPSSHSLVVGILSIMVKSTPCPKWLVQADPCFHSLKTLFIFSPRKGEICPTTCLFLQVLRFSSIAKK